MEVKQNFTIDVAPDSVWKAFHDPELLVSCLPGASLRESAGNEHLDFLFKVKLGPITAAFSGEGDLILDEENRTGKLAGNGTDRKSNSRVKGESAFAVIENAGGTSVDLTVTFTITGRLAQFSREGVVQNLADQLTTDFANNLQKALKQPAPGGITSSESAESTSEREANRSQTPRGNDSTLNALSLLWRMLRNFVAKLLKGPA